MMFMTAVMLMPSILFGSPSGLMEEVNLSGECPHPFLNLTLSKSLENHPPIPLQWSNGEETHTVLLAGDALSYVLPVYLGDSGKLRITLDPGNTALPAEGLYHKSITLLYNCETQETTIPPTLMSYSCDNPTPLTCSQTLTGTTVGGTNAITTYGCSSLSHTGPEFWATFTLTSVQDVTLTLKPNGDARLNLFLLSSCNSNDCIAMADQTIRYRGLEPGTYLVVVDGLNGAVGGFQLTLTCENPETPFYEACFETGNDGFTTTGFWHRQFNPSQIVCSGDMQTFVNYPDYPDLPDACEGMAGFWYGQNNTGTFIGAYNPNQGPGTGGTSYSPNSGTLISPPIDLSGVNTANLLFDCWWEIEGVDVHAFDMMYVDISTNNGSTWTNLGSINPLDDVDAQPATPYSSSGLNTPIRECIHPVFDISQYVNQTIRVRFRFDTVDNLYNAFRGWFVDCVRIDAQWVPDPIITSVAPTCDVTATTLIHIYGENFVSGAKVYFDGWLADNISVVSQNEIHAYLPSQVYCPGPVTVLVRNPNGHFDRLADAFICGENTCTEPLVAYAGDDQSICPGDSVVIGGNPAAEGGSPPYTYQWTPTVGLDDPTSPNPTASPTATTTYTLTVTDANNDQASDSMVLTVQDPPIAEAGPDKTLTCSVSQVILEGSAQGGSGSYSYEWSPTVGLSDPYSPQPTCTQPGTYTLVVRDVVTGCESADSVTVFDDTTPPVISAGPDKTLTCSQPSVILEGSISSGSGDYTILWQPAEGLNDPTLLQPTCTQGGTYTLTVTDNQNNCTSEDSVVVTDYQFSLPATASSNSPLCEGQTLELYGGPDGMASYSWTGPNGFTSTLQNPTIPNATLANGGTYTLTVTDSDGCTGQASVDVTIYPGLQVSAGPDKMLTCTITAVILEGQASGGSGSYTYTWTPTTGLSDPTIPQPTCTEPGTYTLTVTDPIAGCSSQDSVTVSSSSALPTADFSPTSVTECVNTPICFTNQSTLADSYLWDFGTGTDTSGEVNPCFAYAEPGNYTVTLTAFNDCGSSQAQGTVTINPVPQASFTYSSQGDQYCVGQSIQFTDTSTQNPMSWSWDFGDGTTSTEQNPSHTYNSDGVYQVTLTACNACGCSEPYVQEIWIIPDCNTNCSANSHQIGCTGGNPVEITGDTSVESDNYNASYYGCQSSYAYTGPNFSYDLNFVAGSNFIITLEETIPEPNGYELDLILADRCNPPHCVAWGDTQLVFDDHTPANDDYFLIVDGRNGTAGPYRLTIQCLDETQTAQCTVPNFAGVQDVQDFSACAFSGIQVSWSPPSDWGTDQNGQSCTEGMYVVLRASEGDPQTFETVYTSFSATAWVDTQVVPETQYYYKVYAYNTCCGEPALVETSLSGKDLANAPPIFSGLQSTQDQDGCLANGITLTWNPADFQGSSGSYRVLRGTIPGCAGAGEIASGITTTSWLDTTAVPNQTYYYRVEAVSECGQAEDGNRCLSGTDFAGTETEPSAVDQNPQAVPFTLRKNGDLIIFTWEDTGEVYHLYRGTIGALRSGNYDHGAFSHCHIQGNQTSFTEVDGNYYYLVTASRCNGAGETSYGRSSQGERPTAGETTGRTCF